jgi:FkbM family methyltransferase
MRVFLDIGAHTGETLDEVLKDKYAFDRVICFEPSQTCIQALNKYAIKDPRVEILQIGLSNEDSTKTLYNPGELNGSIFSENDSEDDVKESITLVDADTWYSKNLDPSDFVVIKTNCEGSEVNIIDSFLKGNSFNYFYTLLVTFDIRDYPSMAHKELEIRKRLKASGYKNFCFSDDMMIGPTHEKRIENWLSSFGVDLSSEPVEVLKKKFQKNFLKFSNKSGNFVRLEIKVKRILGYKNLPDPIKAILRLFKRLLRMNRERSIDS